MHERFCAGRSKRTSAVEVISLVELAPFFYLSLAVALHNLTYIHSIHTRRFALLVFGV